MTQRVARSPTLLWALVAVTAIVLAAGASCSGRYDQGLKRQAIHDAKVSLSQYASGVLSSRLLEGSNVLVGDEIAGIVERKLAGLATRGMP
jgi:hypothetical protein